MSKSEAGKGDTYRSVNMTKFDLGYYTAFGVCNKEVCPRHTKCFRFHRLLDLLKKDEGFATRNIIPIEDVSKCKWFRRIPE